MIKILIIPESYIQEYNKFFLRIFTSFKMELWHACLLLVIFIGIFILIGFPWYSALLKSWHWLIIQIRQENRKKFTLILNSNYLNWILQNRMIHTYIDSMHSKYNLKFNLSLIVPYVKHFRRYYLNLLFNVLNFWMYLQH